MVNKNMLSKMQKIWLGIFGAMFLIPEILWSPIVSFLLFFLGLEQANLFSIFFKNYDFNIFISLIIILVEFIGAFGLFIINMKIENKLFSIIFGIISFWLIFIMFLSVGFSQMSIGW